VKGQISGNFPNYLRNFPDTQIAGNSERVSNQLLDNHCPGLFPSPLPTVGKLKKTWEGPWNLCQRCFPIPRLMPNKNTFPFLKVFPNPLGELPNKLVILKISETKSEILNGLNGS